MTGAAARTPALLLGALLSFHLSCALRLSTPGADPEARSGAPCATERDCPAATSPCFAAACVEGACRDEITLAGTVPKAQPPGDCRELVCDGRGHAIARPDRADAPADDANDCTEEVCEGEDAQHAPVAVGTACGEGGVCNGAGLCGVCIPRARKCDGNAATACSEAGQWADAVACGDALPVCSDGVCAGVSELALGDRHTCARLSDGSVRCWGANGAGQLGGGSKNVSVAGAVELALGSRHSCARLAGGGVRCWGDNGEGELGDGTREVRGAPVDVVGVRGAVQLAVGDGHSCVRVEGGTVWCWGRNPQGQLGDGSARPLPRVSPAPALAATGGTGAKVTLVGIGPVQQVALGGEHTCVRLGDGGVTCWGDDRFGQRSGGHQGGVMGTSPGKRPAPVKTAPKPMTVRGLKGAEQIALGGDHSCARIADGSVQCWGANAHGQIGDGGVAGVRVPVKVRGLARVASVALGREHTCARLEDGSVQCWGANARGQLGDGSRTERRVPGAVTGIAGAVALVARGDRTCARLANGDVKCWGSNTDGELGDGKSADRDLPAAVTW